MRSSASLIKGFGTVMTLRPPCPPALLNHAQEIAAVATLKMINGRRLSMHNEMAVESMTFRPRVRISR